MPLNFFKYKHKDTETVFQGSKQKINNFTELLDGKINSRTSDLISDLPLS